MLATPELLRIGTGGAVIHALPRLADHAQSEGLFTESPMVAVAASTRQARLQAFLEGGRAECDEGEPGWAHGRHHGMDLLASLEKSLSLPDAS